MYMYYKLFLFTHASILWNLTSQLFKPTWKVQKLKKILSKRLTLMECSKDCLYVKFLTIMLLNIF